MDTTDLRYRDLDPIRYESGATVDEDELVRRVLAGSGARHDHRRPRKVLVGAFVTLAIAFAVALATVLQSSSPHRGVPSGRLVLSKAASSSLYPKPAKSRSTTCRDTCLGPATFAYTYAIGAPFSEVPASQDSFQAVGPTDPSGLLANIAGKLGITGSVQTTGAPTSEWWVGETNPVNESELQITHDSSHTGLYELTYLTGNHDPMDDQCSSSSPSNLGTVYGDQSSMESSLTKFMSLLGVNYSLGAPTLNTGWPNPTYEGCGAIEIMQQAIVVDGIATDQSVEADFNASGKLVDASLPLFDLGAGANYQLVAPASAASKVVASSASPAELRIPGAFRIDVKLRSESVGLESFALTNGSSWFLPVYAFTGDGFSNGDVQPNPLPWSGAVLAVGPPSVTVEPTAPVG